MIVLKTASEIEIMRRSNHIVAEVRDALARMVEAGMTTQDLDREAESLVIQKGAKPAFKGYRGYPCNVCISVNDEIVHGIPGNGSSRTATSWELIWV